MKLEYHELLLNVAFKIDLRGYAMAAEVFKPDSYVTLLRRGPGHTVGRCRLTL